MEDSIHRDTDVSDSPRLRAIPEISCLSSVCRIEASKDSAIPSFLPVPPIKVKRFSYPFVVLDVGKGSVGSVSAIVMGCTQAVISFLKPANQRPDRKTLANCEVPYDN
jgi:hypothetical protein